MRRSVAMLAAAGLLALSSASASKPVDPGVLDTMRVETPLGVFAVPYAAEDDLFQGLEYAIGRDRAVQLPLAAYAHVSMNYPAQLGALLNAADRLDGRDGYVTRPALDRVLAEEAAAAARGEVATRVLEP